jgi:hypothetical protein
MLNFKKLLFCLSALMVVSASYAADSQHQSCLANCMTHFQNCMYQHAESSIDVRREFCGKMKYVPCMEKCHELKVVRLARARGEL